MFSVISTQVAKLGCVALALNGTENHVHLLLVGTRTTSPAKIIAQIKGVSSHTMNQINQRAGNLFPYFDWQDGYGVFSLGWNQIPPVKAYIAQQKERHKDGGKLWIQWEDDSG